MLLYVTSTTPPMLEGSLLELNGQKWIVAIGMLEHFNASLYQYKLYPTIDTITLTELSIASNAIGVDTLHPLAALPCMGVSVGPADPEDPSAGTLVLKYGAVRLDSWNFNSNDGQRKTIFVGSNGAPTQSVPIPEPGNTNLIQPIGSIIADHIMWFYPSSTIFTRLTFKDGDGDDQTIVIPYML